MSRFDVLTKYIAMIQSESIGEWIVDKENDDHQNIQYRCYLGDIQI